MYFIHVKRGELRTSILLCYKVSRIKGRAYFWGQESRAEPLGPTRKERPSQEHARVGGGFGDVATNDI